MASGLWIKPGQDTPGALPFKDVGNGDVWTSLATNAEGREACGYVEVDELPPFDAASEAVEWQGGFGGGWVVVPTVPSIVSRLQLKLELFDRGLLDDVNALIAAGGGKYPIYWGDTSEFHIDHPILLALVAQGGWTQELLEEVFSAAKQQL